MATERPLSDLRFAGGSEGTPHGGAEPWIAVEGLRLSRAGRLILHDISIQLRGSAIGLIGANGAGKSTFIGALLGVLRPDSGSIRVLDLDIPRRALELRTRAGVMAEQAGIFPGGSGVEAVTFAGMLSGLPRREALRRAHRALDALDVGEERYRPTRGYSTGMRQRCKLGMALVHDPEVLILDEPTVGLDPEGRTQFLGLIRDLRESGRRILLSTHVLHDAESVCDELLLIEGGAIGYQGAISALTQPRSGRWRASGDRCDRAFAQQLIQAGVAAVNALPDGVEFEADDAGLRLFWRVAAENQVAVRRLGQDGARLEDAVIEAMGHVRPS
ncbi:MAG: ABC transporter ATP-binding protein [Candidatus Eisenbacteria bacterium]|nr:ABC transporter ATP-binding protein [Candidatus Eisenbacteria bacterium]